MRSRDVVFMEDQTIHDIEKTKKVVPRYNDCLIDLDSYYLIDLDSSSLIDCQHKLNMMFKMTSKFQMIQMFPYRMNLMILPVPEIPPDVPPRRSTRD